MKKLAVIFAVLAFYGCNSIPVTIPTPPLDSPEVGGQHGRAVTGVRIDPTYSMEVINNAASRPPNMGAGAPPEYPGPSVQGYGGMQFSDWIAVTGGLGYAPFWGGGSLAYNVKLQMQVIGDPYLKAEEGNFSMMISLLGNYFSREGSGDQQQYLGSGGFPWKQEATATSLLGSISLGYRVDKQVMWFVGFGTGLSQLGGKIWHGKATDNSDPGGTYGIPTKEVRTSMLGGGVDFGLGRHHIVPKISYQVIEYTGFSRHDFYAMIEWHFDIFRKEKKASSAEMPAAKPAAAAPAPKAEEKKETEKDDE